MSKKKHKHKLQAHRFVKRVCHWFYCNGCGLLALKNEATRRRINEGCDTKDNENEN